MQARQEVAHLVQAITLSQPSHYSFIAKPSSHHMHVTLWVTPPTSPCPTLSADAEPGGKHMETTFAVQCDVTKISLISSLGTKLTKSAL